MLSLLHRREPVRLTAGRADFDRVTIAHRDARSRGRRLEGCFLRGIGTSCAAVVGDAPAAFVGDNFVDSRTHCALSATSSGAFAPHTLEFRFIVLLIHEAAARAAALGPVFLALHLGFELRALAHGPFAGVVADGFVNGHGTLRCFDAQRIRRRKVPFEPTTGFPLLPAAAWTQSTELDSRLR